MKSKYITIAIITLLVSVFGCKSVETSGELIVYKDASKISDGEGLILSLTNGEGFNHPTYAIWMEDLEGQYLKTIFITENYASGIFDNEMIGDTIWKRQKGASHQPAALPYWTHKKGLIDGVAMVPSKEHPFIDAYSGATPKSDFRLESQVRKGQKKYRILMEVNQAWDWNKFWTNSKYPENAAYSHSAQPSIVYAVEVNAEDTVFYLNPIGHGDPKGETGKLYTNIGSLTSAKDIFKSVVVEIKH